jgi:hypothetical protein
VQPTTLLLEVLKSGRVTISQNNTPAIVVNVSNKKIDIDAKDKTFIKELISSVRDSTANKGITKTLKRSIDTAKEVRKMRPLVKEIAEDLCREGITITISYKGDRVITVGSEADSKLTRVVTGTKGIEINRPLKLAEMGI